jgi:hypothetical protein
MAAIQILYLLMNCLPRRHFFWVGRDYDELVCPGVVGEKPLRRPWENLLHGGVSF